MFPAVAGLNRRTSQAAVRVERVPRARGAVPTTSTILSTAVLGVPRLCGAVPTAQAEYFAAILFSPSLRSFSEWSCLVQPSDEVSPL